MASADELELSPAEAERLRTLLAAVDDDDRARVEPPAGLWDRIASAVEADDGVVTEVSAPDDVAGLTGVKPVPDVPAAPVVSLEDARRRRRTVLLSIAAAVVLLAAAGFLVTRASDTVEPAEEVVAATTLDPLEPVGGAGAEARLVRADGQYELVLDTHDMAAAPEGQHYELWLLDPETESAEPVSLGPMTGSTTVDVPDGVDPADYEVVDISLQEAGQTEHSGHSLLRGTLA